MTGTPKMDTAAFREYFEPLETWLKEENRKNGVYVGWKAKPLEQYCSPNSASEKGRLISELLLLSNHDDEPFLEF